MSDEDEARWVTVDRELEGLRKRATSGLERLMTLVAERGDALERRELLVELALMLMLHQQVMLALLRNLQWEVRLLQRQQQQ